MAQVIHGESARTDSPQDRLAEALSWFMDPFTLDVVVMTPKQRAEVPLTVLENIFASMDSPDKVLAARASLACQCLVLCGIKSVWLAFLQGALT